MARRLNSEDISLRMNKLYNGEYDLVSNYDKNSSGGYLLHKKCGNKFHLSRLTRFFNESSICPCPICRKEQQKHRETESRSFDERLHEMFPNKFSIINFTKMHDSVKLRCQQCNSDINVRRASDIFLKNRFRGCPVCNGDKKGHYQKDPLYLEHALSEATDGSEYLWLDVYNGDPKSKHRIRHKICGHEYEVRPTYFRYGDKIRCPKCARKRSKLEVEMFQAISEFAKDAIHSDRSEINPYELDIFLKDKRIAIELNGLLWHSEKHKPKNYHYEKFKKCLDKNIILLQVFEDEWVNSRDVILSKIKRYRGISEIIKADISRIRCINSSEFREFLSRNNTSVGTTPDIMYGLNESDLIAVIGFNKAADGYKISVLCEKNGITVNDGVKYFIEKFEADHPEAVWIEFVEDLRWPFNFDAESLGFEKSRFTKPVHFYTNGSKRFSRVDFMKSKLKEKYPNIYSDKLTEFQIMDQTGLWRIWDAGKNVYRKYLKEKN